MGLWNLFLYIARISCTVDNVETNIKLWRHCLSKIVFGTMCCYPIVSIMYVTSDYWCVRIAKVQHSWIVVVRLWISFLSTNQRYPYISTKIYGHRTPTLINLSNEHFLQNARLVLAPLFWVHEGSTLFLRNPSPREKMHFLSPISLWSLWLLP